MRLWGLYVVALLSCYRSPQTNPACSITCAAGDNSCPGDLTCEGGFCVTPGQICQPSFIAVTAGTGFACGIDAGNALWCWGGNSHHTISPTDQIAYPRATRIDTTRHWDSIDGGGEHVCGIAEGHLYCWGKNDRHQVSETVTGDVAEPLEITGGPSTWTSVSAGVRGTCGIGDGKVWCWGANGSGQLGDGTTNDHGTPAAVTTPRTDWSAVAVGDRHACAIAADGAYCWGRGAEGQIGNGATTPQLTPVKALDGATAIAVSSQSTCATTSASQVYCWGGNSRGELGETQFDGANNPTPMIATRTTGWTAVAANQQAFCGLRSGQTVCWGSTRNGALGNGFWLQDASTHIFDVVTGTTGATHVTMGWNEDIDPALGTDYEDLTLVCTLVGSDALCWGDNRFGQLATGATTMELAPAEIAGSHRFSDMQIGQAHGCAIESGGTLCWGSTESGATTGVFVGGTTKACNPSAECDLGAPKLLAFIPPTTTAIATGAFHSCTFHDGVITCWGNNNQGQLGSSTPAPPAQRDVVGPGSAPWTGLLPTGHYGQCAVYRNGATDATACWGQVLAAPRVGAVPIPALDAVKGFAFGSTEADAEFDCILDATQTLQCMGDNTLGEYGNNTMSSTAALAVVMPTRKYTAIATNTYAPTICGVRPDAHVECWGRNDRGQTSSTTLGNSLTPVIVPGLDQCTAVAVAHQHACAICSAGVSCWGDNRWAQLGRGGLSPDPSPMPQLILPTPAGDSWVQIGSGYNFTCVRSQQGLAKCWGFDRHGGVGNGGTGANLPTKVLAAPAN